MKLLITLVYEHGNVSNRVKSDWTLCIGNDSMIVLINDNQYLENELFLRTYWSCCYRVWISLDSQENTDYEQKIKRTCRLDNASLHSNILLHRDTFKTKSKKLFYTPIIANYYFVDAVDGDNIIFKTPRRIPLQLWVWYLNVSWYIGCVYLKCFARADLKDNDLNLLGESSMGAEKVNFVI